MRVFEWFYIAVYTNKVRNCFVFEVNKTHSENKNGEMNLFDFDICSKVPNLNKEFDCFVF